MTTWHRLDDRGGQGRPFGALAAALFGVTVALVACSSGGERPAGPLFSQDNELLGFGEFTGSYGMALADADRDGDVDIWLTHHGSMDSVVLENQIGEGSEGFVRHPVVSPGDEHSVVLADVDRDQVREALVLLGGGKGGKVEKPMELLGNRLFTQGAEGSNAFGFTFPDPGTGEQDSRGLYYSSGRGRTATLIDANVDGHIDVFVGNDARADGAYPSALFVQQGDCRFAVADTLGLDGNDLSLAIPSDFDGDGRMDLFLRGNRVDSALVFGNGDGFVKGGLQLPPALLETRAEDVVVADFNGDLRPDIWLVSKKNRLGKGGRDLLFLNTGTGFSEASQESGVGRATFNSRNATSGDFDNDGDLDVYEVNGDYGSDWVGGNLPNVVWENVGNETGADGLPVPQFVPRTGPGQAPSDDNGLGATVAVGELNGDGVLDLVVANGAKNARQEGVVVLRGAYDLYLGVESMGNDWLIVALQGRVSNTEGIGAIVRASAEGVARQRTARHGVHSQTQDDPRLHFGFGQLGEGSLVSLRIMWPSGLEQEIDGVAPNQVLQVSEPVSDPGEVPGACSQA